MPAETCCPTAKKYNAEEGRRADIRENYIGGLPNPWCFEIWQIIHVAR